MLIHLRYFLNIHQQTQGKWFSMTHDNFVTAEMRKTLREKKGAFNSFYKAIFSVDFKIYGLKLKTHKLRGWQQHHPVHKITLSTDE